MQYSYDNYERLAQENRDGDITSYTYNLAGQLTEITDTTGKYTYYYDSIGRVTRTVYPDGGNLKPVYDKDNRLTAVHTNLGGTQRTTGYTYLLDGRLSQTALPTGKTVTYSYDPLARLSGSGIDGVLSSSYTYESPGEGKTTPLVSSVTTNGKETEYTYDAFGNILTITEDGVLQHSYTYDARNQLVGETSGTDSYVYSYDAGGNLVSVQKNGEVIKSYTYGDASWKDLLTAFNGQSITYDAIGNPLSYRGMTLSWAGGRRLASVSKEGLSASYVYNTDGIRTQKTVNGVTTNYYLNGSSVLRQVTGNDVLEFFYDANGVLGFYYNNTPYYYLKNLQGDIVGILDANGTQVVSYTYDAWGAPLSVTGTAADTIGQINPFRYRSYYYDNETGFYSLQTRYYDPEIGRFVNADSVIDNRNLNTPNLFQYCGNNPVNNIDYNGHLFGAILALGALAVGLIILGGCTRGHSTPTTTSPAPSTTAPITTPSTSPKTYPINNEIKSYAATVYAEAAGENKQTKRAVAHVMNNRIGMRKSWTSIEKVISAEDQFDGYDSSRYKQAMKYYNTGVCDNTIEQAAMDECLDIVIPIYYGEDNDITGGATYFHSFKNAEDWSYHNSYTQVYVDGTEKFWFYK